MAREGEQNRLLRVAAELIVLAVSAQTVREQADLICSVSQSVCQSVSQSVSRPLPLTLCLGVKVRQCVSVRLCQPAEFPACCTGLYFTVLVLYQLPAMLHFLTGGGLGVKMMVGVGGGLAG